MDWDEWLARFVETIKRNWKFMLMWESQGCVLILGCPGRRWGRGVRGTPEKSEAQSTNCLKTVSVCLHQNHRYIKSTLIIFICFEVFHLQRPEMSSEQDVYLWTRVRFTVRDEKLIIYEERFILGIRHVVYYEAFKSSSQHKSMLATHFHVFLSEMCFNKIRKDLFQVRN